MNQMAVSTKRAAKTVATVRTKWQKPPGTIGGTMWQNEAECGGMWRNVAECGRMWQNYFSAIRGCKTICRLVASALRNTHFLPCSFLPSQQKHITHACATSPFGHMSKWSNECSYLCSVAVELCSHVSPPFYTIDNRRSRCWTLKPPKP